MNMGVIDRDVKETLKMRRLVFTSLAALAVSANAAETRCDITQCPAGSKVVTYATKSEMFYACPTPELAEYTNFLLGLITVQYTLTGTLPNVNLNIRAKQRPSFP